MNDIDQNYEPNVIKNNSIFTAGSLFMFGMSLLLSVSFYIANNFNSTNNSTKTEEKNECITKLYVVENGKQEIAILNNDATLLCKEFTKIKDQYYGEFLKPERRYLLYINDEEIVIDPFNNEYSLNNHSMIFSKEFYDCIKKYINNIGIGQKDDNYEYASNLTHEERTEIKNYFINKEYKTKEINYTFKYNYNLYINEEYYTFDDFSGLMSSHDGTIIVDDKIMILLEKSLNKE